jgi:hypothetical protein
MEGTVALKPLTARQLRSLPRRAGAPYFDTERKAWFTAAGEPTTENAAVEWFADEARVYSSSVILSGRSRSDLLSQLEAGQVGRDVLIRARLDVMAEQMKNKPTPMPSEIYAAMQLSEFYMDTEGDLAETVFAPQELGIPGLDITCPDVGIQREAREIATRIFLDALLADLYECCEIYGQAYPLEQWRGSDLQEVHPLNPKFIWMDQQLGANSLGINNADLAKRLADAQIAEVEVVTQESRNNTTPQGVWRVKRDNLRIISRHKRPWEYYAMPPMRRCFRALGTRQLLDEMVRATIEGYRNQLWVFTLGDAEHMPPPSHINYLKEIIGGGTGERTGTIVWDGSLKVQVIVPQKLDELLGNNKYLELTEQIMTQRGVSLRLVSGTTTSSDSASGYEFDIQILIERIKQRRAQLLAWAEYLFGKIGAKKNWKTLPTLTWPPISFEDQMIIKQRIVPLYGAGLLSAKTSLTRAGHNFEEELANKQAERQAGDLFRPQATFSQTVETPTGTQETTSRPGGRPQGAEDRQPREPRMEALLLASAWGDSIPGKVEQMVAGDLSVTDFIAWMQGENEALVRQAYLSGYESAGGVLSLDADYLQQAIQYNLFYLNRYAEDLSAAEDRGKLAWRAVLYEETAQRVGFMYGVFQSMSEKGMTGWRRVLHPEKSRTGPCAACVADSRLIHAIDEPFFDHPYGVCSAQAVAFYRATSSEIPVVFPVPRRKDTRYYVRRPGQVTSWEDEEA